METLAQQFGAFAAEFMAKRAQAQPARHVNVAAPVAAALNALTPPPSPEAQLEFYRRALERHDWFFQYSDDHSVWTSGRANEAYIRGLQPTLDADGAIWNRHAPQEFRLVAKVAA